MGWTVQLHGGAGERMHKTQCTENCCEKKQEMIERMVQTERILITGASGFLGQAVIRQLVQKKQYNITAVISGRHKIDFPMDIQVKVVNLLEEEERTKLIKEARPQILLHLAWDQDHADFRNSSSNIRWLEVSTSLLRCFVEQGGRCILFAGTSSEYDNINGKAQETAQKLQMSMYGECKKAFSSIMENYCTRTGTRYIDARYFTIYGENDPHHFAAIPQAITDFLRDKPVVCKAPNTTRDYIYVEDAARATALLLENDYCGVVNIGSGQPRMMRDVFSLIAKTLGKEHLLSFENEDICELILVADTDILRNRLGFQPESCFKEKMIATINWWKTQKR